MRATELNVWRKGSKTTASIPIVGIDFGTSNSCVAVWNPIENRAKVIRNQDGKKLTPSTVLFNTESFSNAAVGVCSCDTELPVLSGVKSVFGGRAGLDACTPIAGNATGVFTLTCTNSIGQSKDVDVAELCSFILRDLIRNAELYLAKNKLSILPSTGGTTTSIDCYRVKQAVIGVPAHFNETMKNTLRRAAALAGLEEVVYLHIIYIVVYVCIFYYCMLRAQVHLLIESSAAAMSYGLFVAGSKTVLIFDMGGGTTDVSIIRIIEGKYEVVAVEGHSACGGQNLDVIVMDLLLDKWLTGAKCMLCGSLDVVRVEITHGLDFNCSLYEGIFITIPNHQNFIVGKHCDIELQCNVKKHIQSNKVLFGKLLSLCRDCKVGVM